MSYRVAIFRAVVALCLFPTIASAALKDALPTGAPDMVIGAAAPPPAGYVAFCQRQSAECGVGTLELFKMTAAVSAAPRGPAAAAIVSATPFQAAVYAPAWPQLSRLATAVEGLAAPMAADIERPAAPRDLTLTPALWRELNEVNNSINRAIAQRPDSIVYGVEEYWAEPLEAGLHAGDCEDFVLEKRHSLIAAGVPANALSIAVARTDRGEHHAVLLVATDRGEYVLDNLTPWILPWTEAPYTWQERQIAGSPSQWATVQPQEVIKTSFLSRLRLATLR